MTSYTTEKRLSKSLVPDTKHSKIVGEIFTLTGPHFEIVQIFDYFVRSAPVDFPSKIKFDFFNHAILRRVDSFFLPVLWVSRSGAIVIFPGNSS